MKRATILGGIAVILLFIATIAIVSTQVSAASYSKPGYYSETITGGLFLPTAIDFAPDGRTFVGGKSGIVSIVDANGNLLPDPFYIVSNINTSGDRGLLGIAIDPDFTNTGYVYIAHTHENNPSNPDGPKTARITRVTANGNTAVPGSEVVILGTVGGSPSQPSCQNFAVTADCIPSDSLSHTIGGIRFGMDGKLYVATGDGAGFTSVDPNAFLSQNIDSLAGKILRLNKDGTGAAGNYFHTGNGNENRSKVMAYGFRNSYRFNFDPATGDLYVADVGWFTREELNYVVQGGNYGWPCREGFGASVGGYDALSGCPINTATVDPIYDYPHQNGVGAITGGAFATNPEYPDEMRGNYVFADFTLDFMRILDIENNAVVAATDIATNVGGPVEFKTDPQGYIQYLSIYTGELRRIRYQANTGPQDPIAVIEATALGGAAPLQIQFDGTSSYDPNGESILGYSWDFGDGVTSTSPNPSHTYTNVDVYTVSLTVTNSIGETASKSVTVNVVPPTTIGAELVHVSSTKAEPINYVGSPVSFETTLRNDGLADNVSVYLFVMDSSYDTVGSAAFGGVSFAAGETKTFNLNWLPPGVDTYYYWIGAFSSDWTQVVLPVQSAIDLDVVNRNPGDNTGDDNQPTGPADVHLDAVTTASAVQPNSTTPIAVSFTNQGGAGDVTLDIEVYGPNDQRVAQIFYTGEQFAAGETKQFNIDWNAPSAEGTYYVRVGIFKSDWTELYHWEHVAAMIVVDSNADNGGDNQPPSDPPSDNVRSVISGGVLDNSWTDIGAWNTTITSATATLPNGTFGTVYDFTFNQAWAGIYIHSVAAIDYTTLTNITLWIKSDDENSNSRIYIDLYDIFGTRIASVPLSDYIVGGGSLGDDGWHKVVIPASAFNVAQDIGAIVLQDQTGTALTGYQVAELSVNL